MARAAREERSRIGSAWIGSVFLVSAFGASELRGQVTGSADLGEVQIAPRRAGALAFARPDVEPQGADRPTPDVARLPLAFVENRGQWDAQAKYVARKRGMTAWLGRDRVTLRLTR